jgi:hypothetical protein
MSLNLYIPETCSIRAMELAIWIQGLIIIILFLRRVYKLNYELFISLHYPLDNIFVGFTVDYYFGSERDWSSKVSI